MALYIVKKHTNLCIVIFIKALKALMPYSISINKIGNSS